MSRSLTFLLVAAAAFSACKKSAPENLTPTKEVAAGFDMIDFDPPQGTFSVRAPADWGAREEKRDGDNITFVSRPLPSCQGRLAFIHFLRYPTSPEDKTNDAQKYAETFWEVAPDHKQPALEHKKLGENDAILLHYEHPYRKLHSKKIEYMMREDHALIPVKGGFYQIWHNAPADCYQATLPVFEAVVRSFKPKI
ncbi:MAG: hypothetical protein HYV14_12120 [Elusimicrobia bacterium]|nr:hypothetical protein [Elusimicrobiota bacterium]